MKSRAQQREETRHFIVQAAIQVFSDFGFRGSSTRDIAAQAGVNQGLLTYHFKSKEDLWKAAADHIFSELRVQLEARRDELVASNEDDRAIRREVAKTYVRYAAARPELFRFMVEEGKHPDTRMRWLVDEHLKPMFDTFVGTIPMADNMKPHAFYALAGAASLIFAVAPECQRLTGFKPTTKQVIEAHADYVVNLMVP